MCGIFCKIICYTPNANDIDSTLLNKEQEVQNLLKCRGPDTCCSFTCDVATVQSGYSIKMIGNTLWMQGEKPGIQPVQSDYGVLLFNGDIFVEKRNKYICDTEDIIKKLKPESGGQTESQSEDKIISVLKNLNGPFSLIYWDKTCNKLYFCRDRFGRKSLILYRKNNVFILSSVLGKKYKNALELPTGKIFSLDLEKSMVKEIPWIKSSKSLIIPVDDWHLSLSTSEVDNFVFTSSTMKEEDKIFLNKIEKLSEEYPCRTTFLKNLLNDDKTSVSVNKLIDLLSDSVRVRVETQPGVCKKCANNLSKCESHCTVGILYSGGLDCTILAALAHRHLPIIDSIDLLNVAFEHKNCENFQVPDRLTSLKSLDELKKLFPQRKWNLIQINVTLQELKEKQSEIIGDLVFPLQTILDESLGSALWFAARGETSSYESASRVLLMGMGADELFGGYTRHRNTFKRGGWEALEKELQMDWQRIPYRNLARDDRVVSHHGRQPRMPYLDENFLNFTLNLKPWEKCFPGSKCEAGTGDKMLLRLAALKLGLECTSTFPKRAIQFGSKIANKKENAKDISQKLTQILL